MSMSQTEDIDYAVSDFATPDPDNTPDADQPNKSVLIEMEAYLEEAIAEHSSIDLIDLSESHKMTPTQQIAVHKLVCGHLRSVKAEISKKVKELV